MKILLLDIETSPNKVYAWGLWNVNVALNQVEEFGYTLCWAAQWYGEKEIMFSSLHKDGKKKMLKQVHSLLDEADAVVHYYGKKFDIPRLNQEFLGAGMLPPSPTIQIDLCTVVKSRFKLASNKLDYVSKYLGYKGKVEHKGMSLWTDCMAGIPAAWKKMEEYNKGDIKCLAWIYPILLPWIKNHPNYGLFVDSDRPVCPNCGSVHVVKRGVYKPPSGTLTYQRYRCSDCGTWSKERYSNMPKEQRKHVLKGV